MTTFFDGVQRCIETHGGTVEKFAGDAVMAAFGIPIAHEDDADRAVRAGLGILDHVRELGLEARVGIEAGEVVVDETDSTFATGEAVNVAARLQQAASPGEILMGEAAHRLTVGRIEAESAGPLELRGFRNPIAAYRALAARDGQPHAKVSAPFVGRLSELDLLENTLDAHDPRPASARLHRLRGTGSGEEPPDPRIPRGGRRHHDPQRPRAAVRGGRDVLAVGRDGQVGRRDHGRRPDGDGQAEADRVLRRRGDRRAPRSRVRRDGSGRGRAWRAGDRVGRARVRRRAGRRAAADHGLRGHPLGRRAAAGADRPSRAVGARACAADPLPRTAGAARRAAGLGRRARALDRDRARTARARGQRGTRRRVARGTPRYGEGACSPPRQGRGQSAVRGRDGANARRGGSRRRAAGFPIRSRR